MARRPNVLFVLIDDLGYADLGCYGSTFHETPRLDRLAREGLLFTDGYAAAPVCSPTRASLLTGRYPARVGITNYIPGNAWGKLMGVPYFHELPAEERTVAAALGDQGYATWHVGKWHLGGPDRWPERFGFERNVAGCHLGHPGGPNGHFSPYGIPTLADGPDGEYLADRLTDEAIDLVREGAAGDRPWFGHLSHYAVHTPLQGPAELVAKYRAKARELGLDPEGDLEVGEPLAPLHLKGKRIVRRTRQSDPVYAAMVENLDTNVGRLLDALEDSGQADNTLVIFTSDNGGLATGEGSPTCNAPLAEGKGWMYDGGVREPWLVRWPGVVAPGSRSAATVTSPDLFPTLLEIAGGEPEPEAHADGVSFAPALRGQPFERGPIFWHYPHYSNQGGRPACSVRDGRWKLIEFFEDGGRLELYDLEADIGETNDLGDARPDVRDRLHAALLGWRERIGALVPEDNPHHAAMLAGERPCPDGRGLLPGDDPFVPAPPSASPASPPPAS